LTEIVVIPVARQTHNLVAHSLLTKNGKQVAVGGVTVVVVLVHQQGVLDF
jgi:hypothetical protein